MTAISIAALLDEAVPHLRKNIVEENELSKLEFFKREAFDSFSTSWLLFECPLHGDKKWVDLSICIDSPKSLTPSIRSLETAFSEMSTKDIWKRCTQFLTKAHQLKTGYFGLELDIGSGEYPPAPNFFICTTEFQQKEFVLFANDLVLQLGRKRVSSKYAITLERHVDVCASLEDPIIASGIMLARPGSGIRIHSSFSLAQGPSALEKRLKKMRYPHSARELVELLAKFPPQALNNIGLALDIGDEIGPKVGIEIFAEEGNNSKAAWEPLLALLVQEKLATAEKVEAFLNWPGGLLRPDKLLFGRKINHIKLVFHPGKKLQAKIYLHFLQASSAKSPPLLR